MKTIWIVYPYGDIIGEKFLEARHIRFGRKLAESGYKVIYWTANFSHTFKKMRSRGWKTIPVCENFDIRLVPSCSYKRNISFGRARFEIKYSRSLAKGFKKEAKPDLILTAGTGLMTAFYPVWPYVKKNHIHVIYDIMDVHLFNSYMEQHHKVLLPIAKILTRNIERREKPFYEYVDVVCGLGKNQVEIAKMRTGNANIPSVLVYNSIFVDEFPEKLEGEVWCVYAGSLGPSYDIEPLLQCAEMVRENKEKIRFIIAGAGPQQSLVENASKGNDLITFLGTVDPNYLPSIYSKCDIGLCTYASYSTVDMPDKFYDYTAAGLAIVNSLQGEIKDYVQEAGVQYKAEDSASLHEKILLCSANLNVYKQASWYLAERFDFSKQMEPLIRVINEILEVT